MPTPRAGEAVIRTLYLSIDPTNRIWMSDMEQYMPPVAIGDVMRGGGIGRVVAEFCPRERWRSLPAIALSARTGQKTTNKYRDLVMVPIDGPDQGRTYTIARLHNCSRRYIPPLAL